MCYASERASKPVGTQLWRLRVSPDQRQSRQFAYAAASITPRWTCQSKWVVELRTLFATQAAATTLKRHFSGMRNDPVGNGLLVLLNTIWFEHRELLMGAKACSKNKEVI